MRKIYLLAFLIVMATFFMGGTATLAKEEAGTSFPQGFLPQGPVVRTLPFIFSLPKGEWIEANTGQIFSEGSQSANFVLPALREAPAPIRYPRSVVPEGWEGTFVIAIEVLTTGEVGRWEVMESTGYPLLDETATEAVRKWRFHPATEQGRSVVSCIEVPIRFELKD